MPVLDSFSLKGKVALMTGGAGLYGKPIAQALAEAGAITYMASRNLDALQEEAERYQKEGLDVRALQYDQQDPDSVEALKAKVQEEQNGLDILINNAVARTMSGYDDPLENFSKSMEINATGLFHLTRVFGDWMAEKSAGSIINIGSIQGMVGPDRSLYEGLSFHGWLPDYFFHKGGMSNYTKFVASYYGEKGIRCNCVIPGGFYSEKLPDEFVKRYNDRTFLKRMAKHEDVMGLIVFLASDASIYLTGTNIPLDGGYLAK